MLDQSVDLHSISEMRYNSSVFRNVYFLTMFNWRGSDFTAGRGLCHNSILLDVIFITSRKFEPRVRVWKLKEEK